jgi:hypothetical protein
MEAKKTDELGLGSWRAICWHETLQRLCVFYTRKLKCEVSPFPRKLLSCMKKKEGTTWDQKGQWNKAMLKTEVWCVQRDLCRQGTDRRTEKRVLSVARPREMPVRYWKGHRMSSCWLRALSPSALCSTQVIYNTAYFGLKKINTWNADVNYCSVETI